MERISWSSAPRPLNERFNLNLLKLLGACLAWMPTLNPASYGKLAYLPRRERRWQHFSQSTYRFVIGKGKGSLHGCRKSLRKDQTMLGDSAAPPRLLFRTQSSRRCRRPFEPEVGAAQATAIGPVLQRSVARISSIPPHFSPLPSLFFNF